MDTLEILFWLVVTFFIGRAWWRLFFPPQVTDEGVEYERVADRDLNDIACQKWRNSHRSRQPVVLEGVRLEDGTYAYVPERATAH